MYMVSYQRSERQWSLLLCMWSKCASRVLMQACRRELEHSRILHSMAYGMKGQIGLTIFRDSFHNYLTTFCQNGGVSAVDFGFRVRLLRVLKWRDFSLENFMNYVSVCLCVSPLFEYGARTNICDWFPCNSISDICHWRMFPQPSQTVPTVQTYKSKQYLSPFYVGFLIFCML
jgi:hypothetical protein